MPNPKCKVHKYRRYSKSSHFNSNVYFCINCSSYKRVDMIIGSHTLCWKCGKEMTMTENSMTLKPCCQLCSGLKSIKNEGIKDLVNKIMEKL